MKHAVIHPTDSILLLQNKIDQEKKSKWGSIELYRVEIEKWNPGGHLSLSCRLELHKYPSVFISMAATAEIKLFGKW